LEVNEIDVDLSLSWRIIGYPSESQSILMGSSPPCGYHPFSISPTPSSWVPGYPHRSQPFLMSPALHHGSQPILMGPVPSSVPVHPHGSQPLFMSPSPSTWVPAHPSKCQLALASWTSCPPSLQLPIPQLTSGTRCRTAALHSHSCSHNSTGQTLTLSLTEALLP
jgi:hypothetical protein